MRQSRPDPAEAPDINLPVPVLVVEDDPQVSARLARLLSQLGYPADATFCAGTLAEARRLHAAESFALALINLRLPDGDGMTLVGELRVNDPTLGILVISAWSSRHALLAALRGGTPIDPFIARQITAELPTDTGRASRTADVGLSAREHQVLALVAEGLSNREIAEQLSLSRYTVEGHVKHVYRKLAVSSRMRAVNEARSLGLLD